VNGTYNLYGVGKSVYVNILIDRMGFSGDIYVGLEDVIVGSGSLVVKDLPDNVLVYGSPTKIVKSIEPGYKILKSM
jgi:serine acetyltransferase